MLSLASGIRLNVSINKETKGGEADIFTLGDSAHRLSHRTVELCGHRVKERTWMKMRGDTLCSVTDFSQVYCISEWPLHKC